MFTLGGTYISGVFLQSKNTNINRTGTQGIVNQFFRHAKISLKNYDFVW